MGFVLAFDSRIRLQTRKTKQPLLKSAYSITASHLCVLGQPGPAAITSSTVALRCRCPPALQDRAAQTKGRATWSRLRRLGNPAFCGRGNSREKGRSAIRSALQPTTSCRPTRTPRATKTPWLVLDPLPVLDPIPAHQMRARSILHAASPCPVGQS